MPVVERSESSSDLRGVTKHLIMIVVATVTMVAIFTAILLSIGKTTDSGAAPSPSSRSIFEGAASASPVASESAIAGSGSGSGGQSASGRTVAVFLGDSYTSGMGGSVDSGGFPALVGQRMGWAVWNIGRPGTGYLATSSSTSCGGTVCPAYSGMISLAKTYSPDVVVVSGGRNDLLAHEDPAIAAAVGEFFTTLRAQLPEARIIVTSPLWDDDAEPARLVALAGVIKTQAEVAGAEYLDLGQPLAGHSELVTADGVHPNDDGYAAVSEAIVEQLAP